MKLRRELCAVMALLLVLSLKAYALEPSASSADCRSPGGLGDMTCTSKGLPPCSKQDLDGIWGAGGKVAVSASDRDVDVVVQMSGDRISSKRICYFTKAQEAAERRQQDAEDRR